MTLPRLTAALLGLVALTFGMGCESSDSEPTTTRTTRRDSGTTAADASTATTPLPPFTIDAGIGLPFDAGLGSDSGPVTNQGDAQITALVDGGAALGDAALTRIDSGAPLSVDSGAPMTRADSAAPMSVDSGSLFPFPQPDAGGGMTGGMCENLLCIDFFDCFLPIFHPADLLASCQLTNCVNFVCVP